MKLHHLMALSGAIAASQLALAPFAQADEAAPDARVLGTTEAIVAYCAKVDPADATKYLEQIQLITQGASDESLAKVRKSEEYRQAHESTDESLTRVDESSAVKVCSQSLAQSR